MRVREREIFSIFQLNMKLFSAGDLGGHWQIKPDPAVHSINLNRT